MIRGAGPDHLWDAATREWLQAAPGQQTGWTGDVSSLVRAPVPSRIILHAANLLRGTEIHTWGHGTATVRWHPPEDGATWLAVAHFKTGGPVYDDALSRLGDIGGPYSSCSPPALQPRCARSWTAATSCEWSGRQSQTATYWPFSTGTPRTGASGICWRPTPRVYGNPPKGHPRQAWDDLIAAFHDHGILPDDTWREFQQKTLGRDYRRRVRARLLEIPDPL